MLAERWQVVHVAQRAFHTHAQVGILPGQLEPIDVAGLEAHVVQPGLRGGPPAPAQSRPLAKSMPRTSPGGHRGGHGQGQRTGATAEVQHAHAGAQTRRQVRGVSLERPLVEKLAGWSAAGQCVVACVAICCHLSRGPWGPLDAEPL
jgi:hypothetical protein